MIKLLLCQVYEDVSVGHGRRGYPQECYENTDTFRHPGPLNPSPSEPDMRGQKMGAPPPGELAALASFGDSAGGRDVAH